MCTLVCVVPASTSALPRSLGGGWYTSMMLQRSVKTYYSTVTRRSVGEPFQFPKRWSTANFTLQRDIRSTVLRRLNNVGKPALYQGMRRCGGGGSRNGSPTGTGVVTTVRLNGGLEVMIDWYPCRGRYFLAAEQVPKEPHKRGTRPSLMYPTCQPECWSCCLCLRPAP